MLLLTVTEVHDFFCTQYHQYCFEIKKKEMKAFNKSGDLKIQSHNK